MGCCLTNPRHINAPRIIEFRPEYSNYPSVQPPTTTFGSLNSLRLDSALLRLNTNRTVSVIKGRVSERYDVEEMLGEGSYGSVRVGVDKKTSAKRAVKSIFKSFVTKREATDLLEEVEAEVPVEERLEPSAQNPHCLTTDSI